MNEYVYCANNPITFIDPDGDIPIVLVAMVAWNMYNIYSTAKDAKSFAKKPTLGGGIIIVAGVTPVGKVKGAKDALNSIKFINHALMRIEQRNISKKTIQTVIKKGKQFYDPKYNTKIYWDKKSQIAVAKLLTGKNRGKISTVMNNVKKAKKRWIPWKKR